MNSWTFVENNDGSFTVWLYRGPLWRMIVFDAVDAACAFLRHPFCGGNNLIWKVPLGFRRDVDGLRRSLGDVLMAFGNILFRLDGHEPDALVGAVPAVHERSPSAPLRELGASLRALTKEST